VLRVRTTAWESAMECDPWLTEREMKALAEGWTQNTVGQDRRGDQADLCGADCSQAVAVSANRRCARGGAETAARGTWRRTESGGARSERRTGSCHDMLSNNNDPQERDQDDAGGEGRATFSAITLAWCPSTPAAKRKTAGQMFRRWSSGPSQSPPSSFVLTADTSDRESARPRPLGRGLKNASGCQPDASTENGGNHRRVVARSTDSLRSADGCETSSPSSARSSVCRCCGPGVGCCRSTCR
jgi:hypothetical protein